MIGVRNEDHDNQLPSLTLPRIKNAYLYKNFYNYANKNSKGLKNEQFSTF